MILWGSSFTGYQRELNYRRDDKSFSAFGNRREGSTWFVNNKALFYTNIWSKTEVTFFVRNLSWKIYEPANFWQGRCYGKQPSLKSLQRYDKMQSDVFAFEK